MRKALGNSSAAYGVMGLSPDGDHAAKGPISNQFLAVGSGQRISVDI
ncbi:MAG: hypothetical protein QM445_10605 [Thermotogota bacterium]|nr:hypothetical protein [Thermotogota bacterium]